MSEIDVGSDGLITLKGQDIPDTIYGDFSCTDNELTSLEFGPIEVHGNYWCDSNLLTSLKFCASEIGETLFAYDNSIENLKGIHIQFKGGYINNTLSLFNNPMKSHLLGVILIPRLEKIVVDNKVMDEILNKHLKTRDVLDCQEELIQNGYKEFAQL